MGIDEPLVQEIVQRILTVTKPEKIILFGSAAVGEMTSDSDIDLLIVESSVNDRREEYVRIRRALRGMGYPFDIMFISSQWFNESKDVVGGIAYPAHNFGEVIYEAA